jgi:hypothetical protein
MLPPPGWGHFKPPNRSQIGLTYSGARQRKTEAEYYTQHPVGQHTDHT